AHRRGRALRRAIRRADTRLPDARCAGQFDLQESAGGSSMIRIGIGIGEIGNQPATVQDLVAQAQRAEREGFASGWIANIFGMDAITTAVVVGRETRSIELGTAVVPTYPRHPFAMAQQAPSAQAAI